MLRNKYYLLALLVVACLISCKDFIEPSLEKREIRANAPSDGYQSSIYAVNFWWDEVEDASKYRLQIVSPDFSATDRLIADTIVTTNKFMFNLNPGNYMWRVRAENGSSSSAFSRARKLVVLSSSIKLQTVQLITPQNGLLTNAETINLQWATLFGATMYRIQIDTGNYADNNKIVLDQTVPGLQVNFKFPKDNTYQWRVRAENDTAVSQWSQIYQVSADRTPPAAPKLISPSNNQTLQGNAILQWEAARTAVRYRLYVLKSDSTSSYNDSFPMMVNTTNYTLRSTTPSEKVYWGVSAIDKAGNESSISPLRHFTFM